MYIESDPGRKVNILGGHSIGHFKQKKVYMSMCPSPNGFRDRATDVITRTKERKDALTRATRHVLTRVARRYSYFAVLYTVHCTDEQHTMSSHEVQSALMLTVEFPKMYYTR
jgi:hypothetical protein